MGLATNNAWTGSYVDGTTIDGVNIWNALIKNSESPRHEMVLYYYKESTTSTSGDFTYQYDMQKIINENFNANNSSAPKPLFNSKASDPTINTCSDASLLSS